MECLLIKKMIEKYDFKQCKKKVKLIDEYIRVKYTFQNISELGNDYHTKGIAYKFSDTPSSKIDYSDRVGNNVTFKVDNEMEHQ